MGRAQALENPGRRRQLRRALRAIALPSDLEQCARALEGHVHLCGDRFGAAERLQRPRTFAALQMQRSAQEPTAWPHVAEDARELRQRLASAAGAALELLAPLARTVGPVAFRMLLAGLPGLRLEGIPQWQTDPYLRSVVNLPVAIG